MRAIGGYNRQRSKLSDVSGGIVRARPDSEFSDNRSSILNFGTYTSSGLKRDVLNVGLSCKSVRLSDTEDILLYSDK